MANFSTQVTVNVVPIEEISFTDTSQKAKGVKSDLDKTFSGSFTVSHGTNTANSVHTTGSIDKFESAVLSAFVSTMTDGNFIFLRLLTGSSGCGVTVSDDGIVWTSLALLYPGEFFAGKIHQPAARIKIEAYEDDITFEVYFARTA